MIPPTTLTISCPSCGQQHDFPLSQLRAQPVVIYRDDAALSDTVERGVRCPNCHKTIYVTVPKGWGQDE